MSENSTVTADGGVVVLPKGYVGKRVPETWTLAKVLENMQLALQQLSRHDFNTGKVERARGARQVFTMVCEYLYGNPVVKAFYDWDYSLPDGTLPGFPDIPSEAELKNALAQLSEIETEQLAAFTAAVVKLHPDVSEIHLAFGHRSGWKIKKKSAGWFISLRCFVQGRSMRLEDIQRHINSVFAKTEVPELDRSVYKPSEQCLALVGGHKDSADKRVLVPLTHKNDLAAFVVQDISNCEMITRLPAASTSSSTSAVVTPLVPQKRKDLEEAPEAGVEADSHLKNDPLLSWISQQFSLDPSTILIDKIKAVSDARGTASHFTIPTSSRDCPFARREHSGNHLYLTVGIYSDYITVYLKCHDSDCRQYSKGLDKSASVPLQVQNAFKEIIAPQCETVDTSGPSQLISDEARLDAARQSLADFQKKHPKMNCTVDDADLLQPTKLGTGGYLTFLKNNYYCPLHKKSHDTCDNCVWMTEVQQQLLCRQDMSNAITIPMSKSQTNVIFANINNININVSSGNDALEIRDFGGLEHFPALFPDKNLNALCYKSLNGRTISFAKFAAEMIKGRYVFQDNTWYHFEGRIWMIDPGPDDLIGTELLEIYEKLTAVYNTPQQLKWLSLLINDLGNLNKRKPYTEELERHVTRATKTRVPFDEEPHIIGFQNGVFDSRDCSFRDHRPDDFVTTLLPYDLPTEPDESVARDIHKAIEDIIPNEEVRDYLLLLLSLHLEGRNKHAVGMIWTGTGGNGKGVLKDLVRHAFGPLHAEPPATFLTSERPSPERPAPHLIDLRLKRSVFSSEPEAGKKANSAFLKFITGNDPVSCRACHSNEIISYVPRFLVTLLCNVIPLFQGGQEEVRALWRRLKIFHFPSEFVDEVDPSKPQQKLKDPEISEKLVSWGPEFMCLLIDIYKAYVKDGRRLPKPPAQVEQNLQEQRDENSPIDGWLEAHLERSGDGRVHLHRLMKAFGEFMNESGRHHFQTPSSTIVGQKLDALGYKLTKSTERQRDPACYCHTTDRYVQMAALK